MGIEIRRARSTTDRRPSTILRLAMVALVVGLVCFSQHRAAAQQNGLANQSLTQRMNLLESLVGDLQRKAQAPEKDFWDKLASLSPLICGIVVATVGLYATNVYNQRQIEAAEARQQRELKAAQVQTVQLFMPHLASERESEKRAALVAIAALGNEELAIKLSETFGGSGSAQALMKIADRSPGSIAHSARKALGKILGSQDSNIAMIHDSTGRRVGSGLVVSKSGIVVTTGHIARMTSSGRSIQYADMASIPSSVVALDAERNLALLLPQVAQTLSPPPLESSAARFGSRVSALPFYGDVRDASRGMIVRRNTKRPDSRTIVSVFGGGAAEVVQGAPMFDEEGRFVGLVVGSSHVATFVGVIGVELVNDFLKQNDRHIEIA